MKVKSVPRCRCRFGFHGNCEIIERGRGDSPWLYQRECVCCGAEW